MMGSRGPIPKPSVTRRRRNTPVVPTKTAARGAKKVASVVVPKPDRKWHPVARLWYRSLAQSGQTEFYQSSDWTLAFLIAESISRDLCPQVVGVTENGEVIRAEVPLKSANLAAYNHAFTDLLVTEGARRRASVELRRLSEADRAAVRRAEATITNIRSRLTSR
jgi:hypothetical protein